MHIEYIKHSKSRDSFLQWVKDYERRGGKGIWFELKHQPAPPREAHFLRKNGQEPELLELISYEFMTYLYMNKMKSHVDYLKNKTKTEAARRQK